MHMPWSDCTLEISEPTVVMASASLQVSHFNYFGAGRGLSPFSPSETSASVVKHVPRIQLIRNYNYYYYYYWGGKEKLHTHITR